MFETNYKYLLVACLAAAPLVTHAADWHMVDGHDLNGFANKNTNAHFLEMMPPTSFTDGVNLPAGKPISACRLFNGLQPGFYDVTATVSSASAKGVCYLFGKGEGATMASTMIPVGNNLKVTVRGVYTNGNSILAGAYTDGENTLQVLGIEVRPAGEYRFLQGGDITELNYVLDYGGNYAAEDGTSLTPNTLSREEKAQNVLNYLSANGMNFVRIRLTNNPGQPDRSKTYYLPEGYQDESDCLQLARMAKAAGMDIQFTFNWSDYWSNGTRQDVPADWLQAVMDANGRKAADVLAECAYNYTKKVMQNLAALDVYPAYVSLGNETNGGFLFPYAYAYDVPAAEATTDMPQGYKNWAAIAQIVNAGYKAVKEVSPNSQVVVHLADNTYDVVDKADHVDWWAYAWYFDELTKAGAKFDVIGASYYPSWSTATAAEAAQFYRQLIKRYNRDVLVMETGYNWTPKKKDGTDGQLPYTAPAYKERYTFSKDGQKGFMADVFNEFKGVEGANGHRVVGDLYWDPMMIHVEDQYGKNATGWAHWYQWKTPDANVVENTTLFDFDGKALPAFDAYRYNRNCRLLKKHEVLADVVGAESAVTISQPSAYVGDTIAVAWVTNADLQTDSVVTTWGNGACVFKPIAGVDRLNLEMPDDDFSITIYQSERDKTSAETLPSASLEVTTAKGCIGVTSATACNVDVLNIAGQKVHTLYLQPNQKVTHPMPPGIYMVGNHKVLVE